jgi:hypothetical protein
MWCGFKARDETRRPAAYCPICIERNGGGDRIEYVTTDNSRGVIQVPKLARVY